MTKAEKKRIKQELRLRRLMARLTVLNANPPVGGSEYQRKMWIQERARIIHQLKRHGIEME